MFITAAANSASDGAESISRLATSIVFIHQPTKLAAISIRTIIPTDTTRPGKAAGGKMENRFQQ